MLYQSLLVYIGLSINLRILQQMRLISRKPGTLIVGITSYKRLNNSENTYLSSQIITRANIKKVERTTTNVL